MKSPFKLPAVICQNESELVSVAVFHIIFFLKSSLSTKVKERFFSREIRMAAFWNHTIRRFIQTTAARRSAAAHGSSEGKHKKFHFIRFANVKENSVNEMTLCNMRVK